ncbi:SAM domain-containing protein [Mesorhizobium wenxiniae]|uniref:SAM domain-containing protein n=1 Tax=Mesorhizobium wenxiniae TaxID=2014805 RepID=A0A271KLV2_9HYPH|nr:SAM domain-containing protein [Mesorhizobium wenxiniae]PAP96005.1 hypothetical protein CIT31_09515 [Mesorhizobium wenxiniae]
MDISAWLRDLGLGQYEQAFRKDDIDAEVVADLTADDLSGSPQSVTAVSCSPPSRPCVLA